MPRTLPLRSHTRCSDARVADASSTGADGDGDAGDRLVVSGVVERLERIAPAILPLDDEAQEQAAARDRQVLQRDLLRWMGRGLLPHGTRGLHQKSRPQGVVDVVIQEAAADRGVFAPGFGTAEFRSGRNDPASKFADRRVVDQAAQGRRGSEHQLARQSFDGAQTQRGEVDQRFGGGGSQTP